MTRSSLLSLVALTAAAVLTTAAVLAASGARAQTRRNAPRPDVWINEVHHTNAGADVGEGVELAGPAGTRLEGYRVWTYSGDGTLYAAAGSLGVSPVAFDGTIDDEGGGLGAVWASARGLRGGCQGLALVDPDGGLVEFLSTGGCRFNALSGPVFDAAERLGAATPQHADSLVWSTGIAGPRPAAGGPPRLVQEWSTMPAGYSLQRSGAGRAAADFHWAGPLPASPGRLGDYQAPAARAGGAPFSNRASGWHAGLSVPDGLVVPLVDDGEDEDAPRRPDRDGGEAPQATGAATLALGPPRPNPATRLVRFALSASPDALFSAVVIDALGRVVLPLPAGDLLNVGDLSLDVSRLAAGTYAVRVSALLPGGRSQTTTRRVTVAR